MKKVNSTLLALGVFLFLVLNSCDNESVRGKWSESDKQKYYEVMENVDLSPYGENKTKWIECCLRKAEAKYTSFNESEKDRDGILKLCLECNKEFFSNGSIKGKWSESDKQKSYKAMEDIDLSNLGENKTKWIECYINKAEANYSSLNEADNDEKGCEKIAIECYEEINLEK